jgi:DNA-binding HxlR family transcriptional regulator
MLSKQLREMEADNLVLRKVFEVIPPKVEYSLSEFGESLIPILDSLCQWSTEHEEFIEAIIEDKFIT